MKFLGVRVGSLILGVAFCFLIDFLAHRSLNDYAQRLVVLAGLYVTLSVSLNLINGITGQFSIGHAAFYQIGAYLTGYLSIHYFESMNAKVGGPTVWLFLLMLVGALGSAVAGFVVGLPSLRLRGDYLAIVTLGFGEIVRILVQNNDALGGSYALDHIPKIKPIWLVWLLALVCIAVCRNLLKTARGLTYLSVREDEIASSAMGVDVTRIKVTAFMLGAAFAGAAGALLAHYEGLITPQTFAMDVSFIILTMVVLGGNGSITGSVVAAIFLSYLPEYLRDLKAPDGGAMKVQGSTILAWLIAVAFAVTFIRFVINSDGWPKMRRLGGYVVGIVGAVIVEKLAAIGLNTVKPLHDMHAEAGQLRMVIFAVTLVAIMLIRPQGVFAHHEFSWTWLKGLITRKRLPTPAVSK